MDENILKQDVIPLTTKPVPKKFQHPVKTAEERKNEKEKLQKRRARIIVRNISYKSTQSKLREHFAKFGTVLEVNVLKRSDGKLVGCAFVQFEKVNQAAKAILKCTGKELLGRTVHCDWAVNKDEYRKHVRKISRKAGGVGAEIVAATAASSAKDDESNDDDEASIKSESQSDDANDSAGGSDDLDENSESEEEKYVDDDEEEEEDKKDVKLSIKPDPDEKKPRKFASDLDEGCTVFIKNVPFDASGQDFKKCCLQFGPIYYALLNKDPISGHAKGTGFVKYRAKESADMCLRAGTEFKLLNQVLDPVVAVTRQDIQKKFEMAKQNQPADSRNLYLVKEGMLVAGSAAAEGVSPADMSKRLHLEQIKSQMLKDLNRFLSRERLTVHNIPAAYDSAKLRRMVETHTKLKPTECRVMRENKPSADAPQGKSKGFGFLAFKTHDAALLCLRKLNNNPNVFGKNNRPIVSFSLEDKSVHNLKKKRLQRSLEKNPTFQEKKLRRKQKRAETKIAKKSTIQNSVTAPGAALPDDKPNAKNLRRKAHKAKLKLQKQAQASATVATSAEFTGVLAEPGTGTSRPRWKLNEQSQIHKTDIDAKKKEQRKEREKRELRAEKMQVDRTRQKRKSGGEVDNFSFMVDKYKKMIDTNNADSGRNVAAKKAAKRTKWFDG